MKKVITQFATDPVCCINHVKRLVLLLVLVCLYSVAHAQVVMGANYNENIDQVDPALIRQSGTKWVRAFVPILDLVNINNNGTITGVNNGAVNNVKIGKFLDTHRLDGTNLVLSFKFNYKKDLGRVPDPNSQEATYIINACKKLLARRAGPSGRAIQLGKNLKILTVGNEPMFETPTNAVHYKGLTKKIINQMNQAKNNNNYSYKIYLGAVNTYSGSRNNAIAKATVDLTKTMNVVTGMDIHIHLKKYAEIQDDLRLLRQDLGNKTLICTEWSLHRLLRSKNGSTLGDWGANNGYGRNTKMWQFVNRLIEKRSNGNPISISKLRSFWNSRGWYQRDWVDQFHEAFEEYGVRLATYGMVRKHNPDFRMTSNKAAWIWNALYNDALLGKPNGGQPRANPLSHPRWKHYVDNPPPGANRIVEVEDFEEEVLEEEPPTELAPGFTVYPNPVKDQLNIQFNADKPGVLSLYSLEGKPILKRENFLREHTLYLGDLKRGIYIVTVDNGEQSFEKRIIIE